MDYAAEVKRVLSEYVVYVYEKPVRIEYEDKCIEIVAEARSTVYPGLKIRLDREMLHSLAPLSHSTAS